MWHYETLSIHGGYWLFEYLLFIMLCTSDPVKWNCLLYLYDIRMAWRVNIESCEQRRTQSLTWCKILFLNTTIKFFPPIFYTHTLFIKKMNLNLRAFLHCEIIFMKLNILLSCSDIIIDIEMYINVVFLTTLFWCSLFG